MLCSFFIFYLQDPIYISKIITFPQDVGQFKWDLSCGRRDKDVTEYSV